MSPRSQPRILVVGAGLAGLALARALERAGLAFDIIERETVPPSKTAGTFLPGNAARAFDALDILSDVRAAGQPCPAQSFLDARGGLLHRMDAEAFWRGVGPCLAISRAGLARLLRRSIATPVRYGAGLTALGEGPGPRRVRFVGGRTAIYDLVVGADGVHSAVRRAEFDAEARVEPRVCWRLGVNNFIGLQDWTVTLGPRTTLLGVPLEDRKLYVYGEADASESRGATPAASMRRALARLGGPLGSLVARLGDQTPIVQTSLTEVPAQSWASPGVTLIGNAAHASSPSMAQNVAMALEDAVVLADCLAADRDPAIAVAHFWTRRLARVRWAQKQAQARDRTRNLPGPIRSAALRLFGERLYARANAPLLSPFR